MNRRLLTRTLLTIGAVIFVGSVSAEAYYTHELVQRVESQNPASTQVSPPPDSTQAMDPWAAINADMRHMQARMDQMFNNEL
jgi:hypothetical protein